MGRPLVLHLPRGPRGASPVSGAPGRTARASAAWRVPLARTAPLVVAATLAAACGSQAPGTFHPSGANASAPGNAPAANTAAPGQQHSGPLAWPPFGGNVHIAMPGWLPPGPAEVPAVIAAKDFLLAYLYAEYTGNRDHRWMAYAGGQALPSLQAGLRQRDITTQSFRGTIRFSQMRTFPDPTTKGGIDVAECFDNAHSVNTSLSTGKPIADNTPPDQHYYRNTDVLTKGPDGRWRVVSVYPVVYYPQAKECKG